MIRLTREVRFSVDRDWAGRVDPARPLTNSWGGWPSAVGLVPYLRTRVTIAGEPDPVTGYLSNIKTLDALVRKRVIPFVADELHEHGWRAAPERLVRRIWDELAADAPAGATLERLELLATATLRYAVAKERPDMIELTQQFEFSAAHRLHCDAMTAAENRDYFGKCNNPSGHGHNYLIEVTVRGAPDQRVGAVLPLPRFEQIVGERVIDRLDHKHLNVDTAEFAEINPTVENIAQVVWRMLADHVAPATLANVRVYETPKTWADYQGG